MAVYECDADARRAYVVATAVVVPDVTTQLEQLFGESFDAASTVMLERAAPDASGSPGAASAASARITTDTDQEVAVAAAAGAGGGYLVLRDSFDPAWRVEVDGQPAALLRANALYRADLFEQAGGDPDGVETSICARNYEVELDIRATAEGEAAGLRLWQRLQSDLEPHLFATDERPIAEIVLELARARGLVLVTAESCTGGMVAAELTAIPGSSDVFAGGAVTYSDRLKHELLGVPEATLEQHGAVSAETARAMAEGALRRLGADLAVAVTGVAGPGGGTDEKPVGLVYLHVSGPDGEAERRMQWGGTRNDVRLRATAAALHLLRDRLATGS
jgi:PncC family amidohydrolase